MIICHLHYDTYHMNPLLLFNLFILSFSFVYNGEKTDSNCSTTICWINIDLMMPIKYGWISCILAQKHRNAGEYTVKSFICRISFWNRRIKCGTFFHSRDAWLLSRRRHHTCICTIRSYRCDIERSPKSECKNRTHRN